ncbi:MAG: ferrous iron transport protein B [Hydrogenophilales bacterium 28-61-23]|nr:MAG: ferrous iron transport protein B [Hydrogenophilales bacterium 28-61-23]
MSKRIALVGMPNTGKSTLFNRLTGAGARVGNWPGLTVELLSAKLLLGDSMVELVDLPGLHNLHGFSEDERVARHFIETQPVNGLLVVLNATQLERQLALVLQLKALGLPMLLVLNMADEAASRGIRIQVETLSASLGLPISLVSAKHGQGVPELRQALTAWLRQYPTPITAQARVLAEDDNIEHTLDTLLAQTVHVPPVLSPSHTDRLDHFLLHPWLGLPLFLLIMLGVFQVVYGLGTPLQDGLGWLLDALKTRWLAPAISGLPAWAISFLLEGLYDGIGTVMTFLPIIVVFFLAMAVVEDSGYLARAAFLMDALMSRMGLDGRAFVLQLMGFGCNVPAMMGARVIRSRAQRILTMMTIPFSLCSARLQVFLFFTTAVFSPRAAPWVLFSLYVISFAVTFLTAWIWRGRARKGADPLLMELPPYRLPTVSVLARQSLRESGHFLRQAGGFIILGVALVWFLTHFPLGAAPASPATLAGRLAGWMEPIFSPLGIDQLLSIALLFGFVAKEVVIGALAVIYGAGGDQLSGILAQRLDWIQAYSFMLFTLVYTPCLSALATLRREAGGSRYMWASLVWSLGIAWLLSFAFYQTARALTQ